MLLPNEWIENSIETYIYQHTTKSHFRAGKWGSEAGD